jgi:hypothetical protein
MPHLGPCWMWTRAKNTHGYGKFQFATRRNESAHRVSWFLSFGQWPARWVLHRCDTRACVRPDHLFEGSVQDNTADMMAKCRHRSPDVPWLKLHPEMAAHGYRNGAHTHPESVRRGELNGGSKLTSAIAIDIWNSSESHAVVASRYGISRACAIDVRSGRTWSHATTGQPGPSSPDPRRKFTAGPVRT